MVALGLNYLSPCYISHACSSRPPPPARAGRPPPSHRGACPAGHRTPTITATRPHGVHPHSATSATLATTQTNSHVWRTDGELWRWRVGLPRRSPSPSGQDSPGTHDDHASRPRAIRRGAHTGTCSGHGQSAAQLASRPGDIARLERAVSLLSMPDRSAARQLVQLADWRVLPVSRARARGQNRGPARSHGVPAVGSAGMAGAVGYPVPLGLSVQVGAEISRSPTGRARSRWRTAVGPNAAPTASGPAGCA